MSEISEIIRKMGLFSIGVISLTQEKAEEFVAEMTKKGEMSREEGKKFVREILSERERQMKELETKINETVQGAIDRSGVARKRDIDTLDKRIEKLERMIQGMATKQ